MKRRMFIQTASGLLLTGALGGIAFPALGNTDREQQLAYVPSSDPDDLVVAVIGIGGAGCNVIRRIRGQRIDGVTYSLTIDRDGSDRTPDISLKSGIDSPMTWGDRARIRAASNGVHALMLVVGMGGATGSAIAPLVAQEASACGVDLIVSMVIEPFSFETGRPRAAASGIQAITPWSTTVCRWSNDEAANRFVNGASIQSIFDRVHVEIASAIRHLVAAIAVPGLVGVDFEDVRQLFGTSGKRSRFGVGYGDGPNDAALATRTAWQNLDLQAALPLPGSALVTLRTDLSQLRLSTYKDAMGEVRKVLSDDAWIIASAHHDESYPAGKVQVGILLSDTATALATKAR